MIRSLSLKTVSLAALSLALVACGGEAVNEAASTTSDARVPGTVNPAIWPKVESPVGLDPAMEQRITNIMAQMTLRQKVGQIIQADVGSISPEDVKIYPLGSILNGGNSAPNGDNRSPASAWVELADEFYEASKEAYGDNLFIPMIWGTDAVHGHNNIPGATVFPHNIGLGATRNPSLLGQIGAITAQEIRVGGQEWTFAPTIAVVRDDRWGRTYEGYSENPDVTASYAGELIRGIQGEVGSDDWLKGDHVIATAKHFLADGGTEQGRDQGNSIESEEEIRDIHGAGYPPALEAGVQTVMASFSSWQGRKLTGHKGLLTDVLKGQMGFDGFIVGDWNAHGQLDSCTNTDCPEALHAGLDMYMAPDSWKGLFETTLKQAENGEIQMDRLDDAVRRILRVKLRSGLFEAGKPSTRGVAGKYDLLQDPKSKEVARQAVRESLVLLKNDGVLPLSKDATIVVAGDGVDNIGKQSGGWTLSWQGTGNENSDFPGGSSMLDGIERHLASGSGTVIQADDDGIYTGNPTVAVVVFGEDPYAEFKGDIDTLAYKPGDDSDLNLLKKFQADGIPTVAVFLSGRPMWMNREINASNAFVAAWLPGSEGGYAMDVLFGDADFKGTLPYSWPRTAIQTPLNYDDEDYDPLFAYGYGMTYAAENILGVLPEEAGIELSQKNESEFFKAGKAVFPWSMSVGDAEGRTTVNTSRATSPAGTVEIISADDGVQENIRTLSFKGPGRFEVRGTPIDLRRQNTGDMAIYMRLRPEDGAVEGVRMGLDCGGDSCAVDQNLSSVLLAGKAGEWSEVSVKLSCVAPAANMEYVRSPIVIETDGPAKFSLSDIRLVSNEGQAVCLD
ncbi:glycoside hydrolase family 3 N-terminal domain-containing protein [Litorimonas sp. WD9-15]|uniref:glycoside hydrolase family 3 protein n=1 Tax=Litorimonas sp. WD9-15 TaxID=3418716 RepID=UPI003D0075A2